MDRKIHTYPKTQSTAMKRVSPGVMGTPKKRTTVSGPHLKQGKGTAFMQTGISPGFSLSKPREGHTQKLNFKNVDLGRSK